MSTYSLGAVAPTSLVAARLELHYAAQLVAAAGHELARGGRGRAC